MDLRQASILITGGRRLGAHLAEQLAQRGARITLSYFQHAEPILTCADRCRSLGAEVRIHQADLRAPQAATDLVKAVLADFGRLDAVVNLTSEYVATPWETLTPADYDALIASNLSAPYHTAMAAANVMQRQPIVNGLQGKILFYTDWAVDRPYRNYLPYLVAKGGLTTLTKCLAVELAPGILVNAIAPGTVLPPAAATKERLDAIKRASLLNRTGSADDVTRLALYLLEGTDFVTGEIFRVDGGRLLDPGSQR